MSRATCRILCGCLAVMEKASFCIPPESVKGGRFRQQPLRFKISLWIDTSEATYIYIKFFNFLAVCG